MRSMLASMDAVTGRMVNMATQLNSTDAQWNAIRTAAFGAITTSFLKTGTSLGADAAEAVGTTTRVVSKAHGMLSFWFILFGTGLGKSEPRTAASVTTDTFTVATAYSGAPVTGDTFSAAKPNGFDAVESGTTDTILVATAHAVSVGDAVFFRTGAQLDNAKIVLSTATNSITLDSALVGAPSAGDVFCYASATILNAVASAGTTDTIVADATNTAIIGDVFVMTSGDELDEFRIVIAASAAAFTLNEALSGAPSAAETYNLWTPTVLGTSGEKETTTRLFATAHGLSVDDIIVMTSGGEDGESSNVLSAATDYVVLETALTGVPAAGETFEALSPQRQSNEVGAKLLSMFNATDQIIDVSYDGVTTAHSIAASGNRELDLKSNNLHLQKGNANDDTRGWIYIKANSTLPSSGSFTIETAQ